MPQAATPVTSIAQQRQFLTMLKTVLDRAYQDGVDQFYNWKVDGDTISGIFRDGTQGYKFTLSDKGLSYSPVGSGRKDSNIEGATLANSALRFDGKKSRKCRGTTTYACGGACLPNAKVCRLNGKNVVKPAEMKELLATGNRLSRGKLADAEVFKAFDKPLVDLSPKPPEGQPKPVKKELHQMSIRELRVEAQARGVPGYSHVDKNTLHAMVVSWDKEPGDQKRIVKTIEKRAAQRKADPFNEFKRFFGLRKVLGTGSTITAAILLNIGVHAYNKAKDRYRGGFGESATAAEARAPGVNVAKVPDTKNAITFAIDRLGDHNTGTLETELKKADPFFKKAHFVTIGSDNFETLPKIKSNPLVPANLKESFQAFEATSKRLSGMIVTGYSPQARELAAQALAYHKQYPNKQINFVGDHDGGMVANEAAEILMKAKGGKKIAQNLRIVNLGTPHFGLTNNVTSSDDGTSGRLTTISAGSDPNNMFPKQNNSQINTIKSGKVSDYLSNDAAKEVIKGTLGVNDEKNDIYTRFIRETSHPLHPQTVYPNYHQMPDHLKTAANEKYLLERDKEVHPTKAVARNIKIRGVAQKHTKISGANFKRSQTRLKNANAAAGNPPAPTGTQATTQPATKAKATTQPATKAKATTQPATKAKATTRKQAGVKANPPKNPPGINVQSIATPKMPNRALDAPRLRPLGDPVDVNNPEHVAEWNRANFGDQINVGGKPKKNRIDSIDLNSCSPAYREAFLLSSRRFRRS